jgi:hypothetical protein
VTFFKKTTKKKLRPKHAHRAFFNGDEKISQKNFQKKKRKKGRSAARGTFFSCLTFFLNAWFSWSTIQLCPLILFICPVRRPSVSRLLACLALFCFGSCVQGRPFRVEWFRIGI